MLNSVLGQELAIATAAGKGDAGNLAEENLHPFVVGHVVDIADLLLLGVDSRYEEVRLDYFLGPLF